MDWHKIHTVLLDMDGTLLDLHFDNLFWLEHLPKRYAQIHQLDPINAKQTLDQIMAAQYGSLNWYCTQYWANTLNVDIVALKQEISGHIQLLEHSLEFLQALKQSDKRVILVTNAHRQSYTLKMSKINLTPYFDQVVSSHDYGYPKEDANFWNKLHEAQNINPASSLFIDDNETVLDSAKRFGIQYLLAPQQPDTKKAPRHNLRYPSFANYTEILPIPVNNPH